MAYASGKLRMNKWGKLKIKMGLESYQLDPACIEKALDALPEDEYMAIMARHIEKKLQSLKTEDSFVRNHKVARLVISKGFEPELVWQNLKSKS